MSKTHWLVVAAQKASDIESLPTVTLSTDSVQNWAVVREVANLSLDRLVAAVAAHFSLESADLSRLDPMFAQKISENVARSACVLPLLEEGNRAIVAMADPTDAKILDELAFTLGMPVTPCVATPGDIDAKLTEIYASTETSTALWGSMPRSVAGMELVIRRKNGEAFEVGNSGTAKLFREIVRVAIHINASDAHVQPYGTGAVVRNRVDGVLHQAIDLPQKVHSHLIRHVKAISGMDSTRSFIPQDGELTVEIEHSRTDLRLSVIPVDSGERLVMRLLPQNQIHSLAGLGLVKTELNRLQNLAKSSAGLVLVTGPTGSGKSTLMYAMLAEINTPDINIMTVEQPVEYSLRGTSQINVDTRTGLTFALALRSILRQDPDVVMVGEIRDEETATISTQAALTGHLVLSTVHTLDALATLSRMEDLGVSSNTLSNALRAIVAQRLVRKLCDKCKTLHLKDYSRDEQVFMELRRAPSMQVSGCKSCNSTGYKGRLPLVEVIEIVGELHVALRTGVRDTDKLQLLAARGGTRFLAESMADCVDEGVTTVAEVIRVYGRGFFDTLAIQTNLRKAISTVPISG
jgi:type II secretory ATPase GspE/PulE/Tfp pilus assembly ATPase PilB-like protein